MSLRLRDCPLSLAALALLLPAATTAQQSVRDSVLYEVSPASLLAVKTGKAGLLGFAGHDHLIRARAFSGQIVYYPDAPSESRVEIVVLADSLEVLTPPDTEEIRKVTEDMRSEVLRVDQYREIRFVSASLTPIERGFRVQGAFTLVGLTRPVAADLEVEMGADTLRARTLFSVKLTDFGIRPPRAGPAGTVRVADRVKLDVEVVAVRR